MTERIAFLTTVFPMKEAYLYDFFDSLVQQTNKKFDVIVVNDGYEYLAKIVKDYNILNIKVIKCSDTPAKNREFGIKYVQRRGYDYLIFGDSDDFFDANRVQVSIDKLSKYDILVNDLSLFNNEGIFSPNYLSNRVKNNANITSEFIEQKNIFGLSNSAVNVSILQNIFLDSKLIAVDWHLFSTLLLRGFSAIFTNETETYYRQYNRNTVGLGNLTKESMEQTLLIKLKHYELLQDEYPFFRKLYKKALKLQKVPTELEDLVKHKIQNPLWWEEVKV